MTSTQDLLYLAIMFLAVPLFFGGLMGEILYAGRLLGRLRRNDKQASWRDAQSTSWMLGWLTSHRAMLHIDELNALAEDDVIVGRDLRRFLRWRRATRIALATAAVGVVLLGAT